MFVARVLRNALQWLAFESYKHPSMGVFPDTNPPHDGDIKRHNLVAEYVTETRQECKVHIDPMYRSP